LAISLSTLITLPAATTAFDAGFCGDEAAEPGSGATGLATQEGRALWEYLRYVVQVRFGFVRAMKHTTSSALPVNSCFRLETGVRGSRSSSSTSTRTCRGPR
jgi:hypothetical protein